MKQLFKGWVKQALNECPPLAAGDLGSQKIWHFKKNNALRKTEMARFIFLQCENRAVSSFYFALTHCNLPRVLVKDHGNWDISGFFFFFYGLAFFLMGKIQLIFSDLMGYTLFFFFLHIVEILLCVLLLFRNKSKTLNVFHWDIWPPRLSFRSKLPQTGSLKHCTCSFLPYLGLRSRQLNSSSCWWQVLSAGFAFLLCTVTITEPLHQW